MHVHTHEHTCGTCKERGWAHWWWESKACTGRVLSPCPQAHWTSRPEHSAKLCSSLKSDLSWVLGMLIWRAMFMLPENWFWRQNNPDKQVTRHFFRKELFWSSSWTVCRRPVPGCTCGKGCPSMGNSRNDLLREPEKKNKCILPFQTEGILSH